MPATKTKADKRVELLEAAENAPTPQRSAEWEKAWGALTVAQGEHEKAARAVSDLTGEKEACWEELPKVSLDLDRTLEVRKRIAELVIAIPQAQVIKARTRLTVIELQRALDELEATEALPEVERTGQALKEAQEAYDQANGLYLMKRNAARYVASDIASARTEIDKWNREVREAVGTESAPVVRSRQDFVHRAAR